MATTARATFVTPQRRSVYISLSLLMAFIAVVGFWPTYFRPLVDGTVAQPILIHIHATVFTGWLLLFFAQAALVATRHVQWHLRLGRIGIWYGVLLIVVGLVTGVLRAAERPVGGPAERLLFQAVADMAMFSGFFAAAIVYKRKPQMHRRLMVVAATTILVAAVSRMTFLPAPPMRLPANLAIWSMPILLAMVVEFRKNRTIHPIYLIGLGVLVLRRLSISVSQTPAWVAFADWVFGLIR